MSENLKKTLHTKGLEITFFVENGVARVEYSAGEDYDLGDGEDVVLFINGDHVAVQASSPTRAVGIIGEWERYADGPVHLMTRVGEFFDGWEFDP